MNRIALLTTTVAALGLSACATTADTSRTLGTADMFDASGKSIGTARLTERGGSVMLTLDASNLAPGEHGLHLHAVGKCEAPGFTSAGPHLNPTSRAHGMHNPAGAHLGDLPNLMVGSAGTGTATATLQGAADTLLPSIFDQDGTAIVVHAGPDDYMTDPAGNSGSRIACGVFKPA
ncbi:superoxide dismutase family protein [Novosphingobium olei]|uniref:superoxide dismutase family protein n=1 Tax=Novosphingobium olei TaxID=2728851 RepID=UPI00308E290B|nr:superoxide dismutase family protein [Novosphingobium olei]